jgi:hypothetical protein
MEVSCIKVRGVLGWSGRDLGGAGFLWVNGQARHTIGTESGVRLTGVMMFSILGKSGVAIRTNMGSVSVSGYLGGFGAAGGMGNRFMEKALEKVRGKGIK